MLLAKCTNGKPSIVTDDYVAQRKAGIKHNYLSHGLIVDDVQFEVLAEHESPKKVDGWWLIEVVCRGGAILDSFREPISSRFDSEPLVRSRYVF